MTDKYIEFVACDMTLKICGTKQQILHIFNVIKPCRWFEYRESGKQKNNCPENAAIRFAKISRNIHVSIPHDGIAMALPYPETSRETYDFIVKHNEDVKQHNIDLPLILLDVGA